MLIETKIHAEWNILQFENEVFMSWHMYILNKLMSV